MLKLLNVFSFSSKIIASSKRFFIDNYYRKKCPIKFYDTNPPYLKVKLDIPEYDHIQVLISSLDFSVLENYSKYIHNWIKRKGFYHESYAVPHTSQTVSLFLPSSNKVKDEFALNEYRRVINMYKLQSTKLPLILEVLSQQQPVGVRFTIDQPSELLEEFRYVPELEKEILQQQLKLLDK